MASADFVNGDLVQAVNVRQVKNVKQLNQVIQKVSGAVQFKVVRNQQVIALYGFTVSSAEGSRIAVSINFSKAWK
ncbi:hypothetical protein P4C99_17620 [Pontiellaceae bacterium B1224]|nr:hypothetical protein [Pontiellaceae bacterium B1224]